MLTLSSQIIITSQIKKTLLSLEMLRQDETIIEVMVPAVKKMMEAEEVQQLPVDIFRVVGEKESFRLADAKVVVEKAYLASLEKTVIILVAPTFSTEVQNKLLKIIEEPPENKYFIFLTESKSAILPTIKSRLPITVLSEKDETEALELDLRQLSLASVYDFIQRHKRSDAKTMKLLIERIAKEAMNSESYNLDEATLTLFSNAYKALDVGSPAQFVLNTLFLKLLARKKR